MERLADIMTKRVVAVEMDDDLREIRRLFDLARFHHLMVVRDGQLRGVISDRDLLKNLSPYLDTGAETRRDLATLDRKAHQIMTRTPVSARPDTTVAEAGRLLVDRGISCLPVVTSEGALVGVVTWKDLLRRICAKGCG